MALNGIMTVILCSYQFGTLGASDVIWLKLDPLLSAAEMYIKESTFRQHMSYDNILRD